MAKLFIGIALAIMLATAALGFLAKGNVDKLQSSLKGAKGELTKEQGNLQTAKNDLKKSVEERDAANTKAEDAAKALDAKDAEVKKAAGDLTTAQNDLTAKTKELEEANAKIVVLMNPKPATDGGVEPPVVTEMKAQVAKAQTELAEAKQLLDTTINKGRENEMKLAELQKEKADRSKGLTRPGLQGRVLAVNSGWNFVVLSVGDKQGVMVNSSLLVVRDRVPIARLRVTSVEPSTSIADLVPGSVARGVSVQPGDTVIFEGRTDLPKAGTESETSTTPPLPRP